MAEDRTIKAALEKEARQIELPPGLLERIQAQAESSGHPGVWSTLRLGAKLELVAAVIVLAVMLGLAGYRAWTTKASTVVEQTPPVPTVPVGPEPGPTPSTECTSLPLEATGDAGKVSLFFTCSGDPFPSQPRAVSRNLPTGADPVQFAVQELLKGPTGDEQAKGLFSFFSSRTAGMLKSVTVTPQGRAVVDFSDYRAELNNASTSAGSNAFLQELSRTIFQFPEILEAEFRQDGSCEAFWTFLQRTCQVVSADGYRTSQDAPEVLGIHHVVAKLESKGLEARATGEKIQELFGATSAEVVAVEGVPIQVYIFADAAAAGDGYQVASNPQANTVSFSSVPHLIKIENLVITVLTDDQTKVAKITEALR